MEAERAVRRPPSSRWDALLEACAEQQDGAPRAGFDGFVTPTPGELVALSRRAQDRIVAAHPDLWLYPSDGPLPEELYEELDAHFLEAYEGLVAAGFTWNVIKDD